MPFVFFPPTAASSPSGVEITLPLSNRSPSSGVDRGVLPVAIDGREYMIDLTSGRYRRTSVDVLKTRTNQAPNENLLVEPEVWRTQRTSWHLGAGQSSRDRETSEHQRFYSSRNVDPWEQWKLSLLHSVGLLHGSTGDTSCFAVEAGLIVLDGAKIYLYPNAESGPSSATLPSAPVDFTTDGLSVYLAYSDGTVTVLTPPALTGTTFATLPGTPGFLTYMKGLVVASVGPALYDISGGVADDSTKFYVHPLPTHEWVDGTDGLAAGYLLGGQGNRWHVYWVAVTDDGTTFSAPVVAAPLPVGETGYALGSYLGNVLIGTDAGVRFAAPSGDNTIVYGRAIETGAPVTGFEGEDRFVWFGIGGATPDPRNPLTQVEAGLARMDLSAFTSELTPAYASDLTASVDGTVSSVASLNGRRVFSVPGAGVYVEQDTYVGEGWLLDGEVTMGVNDRKVGLYLSATMEPLVGEVHIDASYDDGDYVTVLSTTGVGAVSSGNNYLDGQSFRTLDTKMRLVSDIGTPVVTSWDFRAVPSVGSAHQWEVPLLIHEVVQWEGAERFRDLSEDVDAVLALVESGRTFTFREGERSHTCYATKYEWFPTSITESKDMWQGVLVLTMRSLR